MCLLSGSELSMRRSIRRDRKTNFGIRQQLVQHMKLANPSGCGLSAVPYFACAVGTHSAVQKIAVSKDDACTTVGNNA